MTNENVGAVKIDGYLEKKGKMKMMATWKRYWFVLEGRLLLYYRSREEYEALSPCKGSINMGLAMNVRPALANTGVFHIVTRTNTITLRAKERVVEEKWLQALLDATGLTAPTASSSSSTTPVRMMSHFRYSMDDLIPASNVTKRRQRQQQQPTTTTTSAFLLTRQYTLPNRRNSIIERIRLIGGRTYASSLDTISSQNNMQQEQPSNAEPPRPASISSSSEIINNTAYITSDVNENCVIENDQYIKSDDYEEVHEPELPPRPNNNNNWKTRKFTWFRKKRFSSSFIMKAIGVRRTKSNDDTIEPIYDAIDYNVINAVVQKKKMLDKAEMENKQLVKTLIELQETLETSKSHLKKMISSNDLINEHTTISNEQEEQFENEIEPPDLPPRHKCHTPNETTNSDKDTTDYSLDQILNDLDLEAESKKSEELSVRRLIEKFNQHEENNNSLVESATLRTKCENSSPPQPEVLVVNRHSDELNLLLEELTKVTCAPLLVPGATTSLVQMKSPQLTDEEWLAIAPIRRRRHSDPDYDVPRSHRSLQIIPQTSGNDSVIPATRFFGPVLQQQPPNTSWTSITPDSLEPNQMTGRIRSNGEHLLDSLEG